VDAPGALASSPNLLARDVDYPPINTVTADTVAELTELVDLI
jgi:hypothetical protein